MSSYALRVLSSLEFNHCSSVTTALCTKYRSPLRPGVRRLKYRNPCVLHRTLTLTQPYRTPSGLTVIYTAFAAAVLHCTFITLQRIYYIFSIFISFTSSRLFFVYFYDTIHTGMRIMTWSNQIR